MALSIDVDQCTSCGICEPDCPSGSIHEHDGAYTIDGAACTECEGHATSPRCIDNCPVEGCISPA